MKKYLLASAVMLLVGAGCQTSQPVPQTPPANEQAAPQPQPEPQPVAEDPVYGPAHKANFITVDTLRVGDVVHSPLVITGHARGNWFFEASFPVTLVDSTNRLIANGVAQAQGDWMTTDFVPYKVTLTFLTPDMNDMSATLVFRKDNPSGLPQNDDQMRFPVRLDINDVNTN